MNIIEAKHYFYHLHDTEVNQKYAKTLPYSFHLDMVYKQGEKFIHLVNDNKNIDDSAERVYCMIGCYGHDSIEDARLSYNEIKEKFCIEIAEIIFLCTENRGRTRDERKNDEFYIELKQNKLAVFVKLCDFIANLKFSLLSNSSMFNTYRMEYYKKIKPHLYDDFKSYRIMFDYIESIINVEK